ncbi:MAG: arylsulfatase A-like enzyme [Halioglobus sp.]
MQLGACHGSFADYGPGWGALANTPGSFYKTFSSEGGIRVPFIAWYHKTKGTGEWQLYDISVDPSEMHNLANDMPDLFATLKEGYKNYEKENGVVPVPADYDVLKQLVKNAKRGRSH